VKPKNIPIIASIMAAVFLIAAVVMVMFTNEDRATTPQFVTLIGLVVTTIPSLIAAAFAERSSRDIRNGVVTDKAKDGALKALEESGVTTVAKDAGEATRLSMIALSKLLEANTSAVQLNTDTTQMNTGIRQSNPNESVK
jgi:uncharacterized membrane protein